MNIPTSARLLAALVLAAALPASAQQVRVVRFEDSVPFQMGDVTSRRIIHPSMGAKHTTLNYSVSKPGAEFAQHVHDSSDDTILVLQGEVNLRQGDSRRLFRAGEAAFVPAGQIHGTVTAGTGEAIMISFQTPPDLVLYTGARDSSKAGAAPPKGVITPGAVQFLRFDVRNTLFTFPGMGSKHAAAGHHRYPTGTSFTSATPAGAEHFLFVLEGSIEVRVPGAVHAVREKDAIFFTGKMKASVKTTGAGQTQLIDVQAPAYPLTTQP
jgi:quercetin dioxygenase-like cupin family protein